MFPTHFGSNTQHKTQGKYKHNNDKNIALCRQVM